MKLCPAAAVLAACLCCSMLLAIKGSQPPQVRCRSSCSGGTMASKLCLLLLGSLIGGLAVVTLQHLLSAWPAARVRQQLVSSSQWVRIPPNGTTSASALAVSDGKTTELNAFLPAVLFPEVLFPVWSSILHLWRTMGLRCCRRAQTSWLLLLRHMFSSNEQPPP